MSIFGNLETTMDSFIVFVIIIKVIFFIAAITHIYFSHFSPITDITKSLNHYSEYWKDRTEFIFIASMAILLIVTFNPKGSPKHLKRSTMTIFFLFGWVLLLTAKWSLFFKEAPWFKQLQTIIRGRYPID